MADIMLGKVVAVHPESHTVDVLLLANLARLVDVPVLSVGASSSTGLNDLPIPTTDPADLWAPVSRERDIYAVITMVDQRGLCLGFIYPDVSQMMFEAGRRIQRHGSDVYSSVDDLGNMELRHPSGTYLRVATNPAHEDLTGQDADALWAITRNTAQQVHMQLQVANADGVQATVHIDPTGNVSVTCAGNMALTAQGAMALHADGALTINSDTGVTITGPTVELNP